MLKTSFFLHSGVVRFPSVPSNEFHGTINMNEHSFRKNILSDSRLDCNTGVSISDHLLCR